MSQRTLSVEREESVSRTRTHITRDEVFELLSNQRRRFVLHYLEHIDTNQVELRELAEQVAAWENEKSRADLSPAELKRVQTALHQFHLPKMDDSDVVDYDTDRQLVTLTEPASDLRVYLDVVPGKDIPWGPLYLGLTGICGLYLVAVWSGVLPVLGLSSLSWAVFFVVTFGVTSTIHTGLSRRMRLGAAEAPPEVGER